VDRRTGVLEAYQRHVNVGQAKLARFLGLPAETAAEGALVVDDAGREYLDCGGYGVFLLGHRHPAVVGAVHEQLDRQPLSTRLFLSPQLARAATLLSEVAPAGLERVTFTNSGSEAVELALKVGRAGGRHRVVATRGGFHGKTLGALSVTGRHRYRAPFEPLLADVVHVPFGDVPALEAVLAAGPPSTVVLEPVQGEGGVRLPPEGYLTAVRRACTRHGALMVVDEIQTGLGRLGRWWGVDQEAVRPDLLLVGKTLGGGVMPLGAVVATPDAYAPLDREPLLHSSTFAGNPLATTAAAATIGVLRSEGLVERAAALGAELEQIVREAAASLPVGVIREVRARGLLAGIEFARPHHAAVFLEEMLNERVIVSYSLNADAVARLTPPAVLSSQHLEWIQGSLARSLKRLTS
jgi:putrescine aminotransferase